MRKALLSVFAVLLPVCAVAGQWNLSTSPTAPPARLLAPMTYDVFRGEVVVFGGWAPPMSFPPSQVQTSSDTWTYDGADWTLENTAAAPARRCDSDLVFDWKRGVTVLFGGASKGLLAGPTLADTWEWDGTAWTEKFPAASPGPRAAYGSAFDFGRSRTVLYGGLANVTSPVASTDTWEYDGTTWTQVVTASNPGPRERPAMCFHMTLDKAVLFGGIDPQVGGNSDTWTYDGSNWALVATTGAVPSPRSSPRMVYDWTRQVVVLYGGHDPRNGTAFDDTWEFDGASWTQTGSGVPTARVAGSMAFDVARKRPVMFGGATSVFSWSPLDETWEYGADYRSVGSACAGSNGLPTLSAATRPVLGATMTVDLSNLSLTSSSALFILGTSNPALDLTGLGMPGCRLYSSTEILISIPAAAGTASVSWTIPTNTSIIGARFFNQGVSIDPTANPTGLALTNGGVGTVGR